MKREPFTLGGVTVKPGQKAFIDLRIPDLYTNNPMYCRVQVIHGRQPGPTVFISGAIHGDEINGVEIIRRVLQIRSIRNLKGTLIAVPVVNVFGFIAKTRYLPDRRDLNRSFPGSEKGSLAGRTAHLFLNEIVKRCTHGIDLHTAAVHRDNFPQVRAVLGDPETKRMAEAFAAPIIVNTGLLVGSLRHAGAELGVPIIVYEAGEALRFDEVSIRAGVRGVISTLRELGLLVKSRSKTPKIASHYARSSLWVRAPKSGILRSEKKLGDPVTKDEILATVSDPFGESDEVVTAPNDGLIIGRTNIPLVNEGEALFHIARFKDTDSMAESIEGFQYEMDPATDDTPSDQTPIV